MMNVSSLKSNKTNSPKTPGGISKSLLTPCRRVGLSRNWRKNGPSPFISPLCGSVEPKEEINETRKRKERVLDGTPKTSVLDGTPKTSDDIIESKDENSTDIDRTPSRNLEVPRRKKSKTLLSAINKSQEDINIDNIATDKSCLKELNDNSSKIITEQSTTDIEVVSTPVRTKSKKSKKRSPASKPSSKEPKIDIKPIIDVCSNDNNELKPKESPETVYTVKEKSPNDLSKECIVVIQRKIFKNKDKTEKDEKDKKYTTRFKDKNEKSSSQALFDSDSDEVPLNQLNDKDLIKSRAHVVLEQEATSTTEHSKNIIEDDDFFEKSNKIQMNKVNQTKSPKNKLKTNKNTKMKSEKVQLQPKPSSQGSYNDDDDDDDDFDNKKTILIRKTYDKVVKPSKAKSTGSITQKDVDELRARIEAKKKLLLAQTITPDTEELRTLIKKWQKGCQDALMELMDLMKSKCHDKQDMDYAQMLKTLKIPPSIVGYDSENDCFNSPDDATIILGQFKDV